MSGTLLTRAFLINDTSAQAVSPSTEFNFSASNSLSFEMFNSIPVSPSSISPPANEFRDLVSFTSGPATNPLQGPGVSFSTFAGVTPVPELDPGSMAAALTLLGGGTLTLSGRRRK